MKTSAEPQAANIDKQALYGWWHKAQEWQDKLHRKAAHKALDIEDDVSVNSTTQTNSGIGWKELAVIGAILLAGGYGLTQLIQTTTVEATAPVDSEYEVRFYDQDGKIITVPRWTGREVVE